MVTPLVNQCSALVRTTADANAIAIIRETVDRVSHLRAGDFVETEVLDPASVFETKR